MGGIFAAQAGNFSMKMRYDGEDVMTGESREKPALAQKQSNISANTPRRASKTGTVSTRRVKDLPLAKIWAFGIGQFGWALLSGIISNWLVYFYQPDRAVIRAG